MTLRRSLILVLALALPAALAACGDDSDDDASDEATEEVEVTDEVTDEATDDEEAEETDGGDASELPDPCVFAPADTVTAAIGITVEETGVGATGDISGILSRGCSYRGTSGDDLFASVQLLGGFDDPAEVEETFSTFGGSEPANIEGLPDSTFVTDVEGTRTIFVVDAAQAYGVNVQRRPDAEEQGQDEPELAASLALALYQAG